jgi:two-component system, response regulator YesN
MRVLIVDDDIPTVEVIKASINWKSYGVNTIETAYNIQCAKEQISANVPDIIISDIEMPKGSGIDLIKWVRENNYTSEFIFLTCHESFEFASMAINYEASAYVLKPFNILKTEAAVAKVAANIIKNSHLHEYSNYGKYWINSKGFMEGSFWADLLFYVIPAQLDIIQSEIFKRHLSIDINESYYLILTCIGKSQLDDSTWDENNFKYALRNITSEVILGQIDFSNAFSYLRNENYCNVIVLDKNFKLEDAQSKCQNLIAIYQNYLHCNVTCYISQLNSMDNLAKTREFLEEKDRNNITLKGKVISQKDNIINKSEEKYSLNLDYINSLFNERKAFEIVNMLRKGLEMLANKHQLDSYTLNSIQQDFLQVVYSNLHSHGIQAHKLLEDRVSQKLLQYSKNSIFDMMKWATFITNKTINFIKEIERSEDVVEKIKRFIHENYHLDIGRDEISSHVFLTPDYISKLFKSETGLNITDYINEYRINKAKELLIQGKNNISAIAQETGFSNFSYFSFLFKKITGKSPRAFKKDKETDNLSRNTNNIAFYGGVEASE